METFQPAPINIINVDDDCLLSLIQIVETIEISPSDQPELYCKQMKQLSELIPENIKLQLNSLLENVTNRSAIIFKCANHLLNEHQNIPYTPPNNKHKIGEKTILAKIQSLLVSFISNLVSYEAEGYGRIFQDIVPDIQMANQQSSVGSNKELEIHTEQAFSKLKPDFLSLSCIRGDNSALTYILPMETILSHLDEPAKKLLQTPLWKIGVDYSFKLNGNEFIDGNERGPIPIININGDDAEQDPLLVFDQDLMLGITEEASEIIKKITNIYYEHRIQHCLQPGEIMIINNNKAVHGRSGFTPKYDGKDRFLIRCFGMLYEKYEKTSYAREDNTVMFSAIYS
jgi:alpha-ketoglutarate-dependent taurine dioxygenase